MQDSCVVCSMSYKDLGVFIGMPAEVENKEHGKISSYQVFLPYFWILGFFYDLTKLRLLGRR